MLGRSVLYALGVASSCAVSLLAIWPTGTIVGTVSDLSGAVVSKARITARVDFCLLIDAPNEEITVTDSPPLVQATPRRWAR
jgi:hypothetical protein